MDRCQAMPTRPSTGGDLPGVGCRRMLRCFALSGPTVTDFTHAKTLGSLRQIGREASGNIWFNDLGVPATD